MLPSLGNCTLGLVLALALLCATSTLAAPIPTTAEMDTTEPATTTTEEDATTMEADELLYSDGAQVFSRPLAADYLFADPPDSDSEEDSSDISLLLTDRDFTFAEPPSRSKEEEEEQEELELESDETGSDEGSDGPRRGGPVFTDIDFDPSEPAASILVAEAAKERNTAEGKGASDDARGNSEDKEVRENHSLEAGGASFP